MYTNYKINNEKVLSLFTWDLFKDELVEHGKVFVDYLEGYITDCNGKDLNNKVRVSVCYDKNGYYFNFESKKIYVHDYDYLSLDELIEKIHKGDISFDEFVSTFVKEGKNVIITEKVPALNQKMQNVRSYEYKPLMMDIDSKLVDDEYKECMWYHKIALEPISLEDKKNYGVHEYYTSDLYSLVKNGYFKLSNKSNVKTLKKLVKKVDNDM